MLEAKKQRDRPGIATSAIVQVFLFPGHTRIGLERGSQVSILIWHVMQLYLLSTAVYAKSG